MPANNTAKFITSRYPYNSLKPETLDRLIENISTRLIEDGEIIYEPDEELAGIFMVISGHVSIFDANDNPISYLGPGNSFGERGFLQNGRALTKAIGDQGTTLAIIPGEEFKRLMIEEEAFRKFFERGVNRKRERVLRESPSMELHRVGDIMTRELISVSPETTIYDTAQILEECGISSVLVVEDKILKGIVTTSDLVGRVIVGKVDAGASIKTVMTENPLTVDPDDLGQDLLQLMAKHNIGHFPVIEHGAVKGIITRSNLLRRQALSSGLMTLDLAQAQNATEMKPVVERIPQLLAQLVGSGMRAEVVTRLITDIADAVTKRLLVLGEEKFGAPPVPYLWLACGSQGRQEQTGVSDQDNAMFIHNDMKAEDDAYFAQLAKFVSDGLDEVGYYYCPGDMMATNPQWRQPVRVWEGYFRKWISKPDPMAQMLASVMYDCRPIYGDNSLFESTNHITLQAARANSIFVAHMISNSVGHTPPLSLFRGFSLIRSGEHKNTIDLKHNGVVPIVDLGRIYALLGAFEGANTRERLQAAEANRVISPSGAQDLIDAFDLINQTRLDHQARQVRNGSKPDNFMNPEDLSDFERSHLRDAFVVVKTMQSALSQARGART